MSTFAARNAVNIFFRDDDFRKFILSTRGDDKLRCSVVSYFQCKHLTKFIVYLWTELYTLGDDAFPDTRSAERGGSTPLE